MIKGREMALREKTLKHHWAYLTASIKFMDFDFLLNSGIPSFIGRHLISSVKQGRGYFHTLQKETLERKSALKSAQQKQQEKWRTEWQPARDSSDEEDSEEEKKAKKKKKTIIHTALVCFVLHFHSEPLFRQLCALHWLLEALTLEPNCSLKPVLTCWNPKDPGGSKSTFKKTNKDKAARYRWEHFIMDTKVTSLLISTLQTNKKTSIITVSRLSGLSSPHSRTPLGSISSLVPSSEDNINVNTAPIDVTKECEDSESVQSKQTREDEEPVSHCKLPLLDCTVTNVFASTVAKIFILKILLSGVGCMTLSRSLTSPFFLLSICKMRAIKHNHRQVLRGKSEVPSSVNISFKDIYFSSALLCYRFSCLLSRIPDAVKNDNHTQRILKKLEKFGKNPDVRIRPTTFLKVLSELRVWELCSPDICAAVEFVRENIVQMPEEDYKAWLQTRVRIPRRAHSAPPLC
uniref:Coiled-coil domain containing 60 n=1 Tax=Chelonoidis abingdonii TaxID=106734 RepID=A0A8C0JAD4_CHEAB